MHTHEKMNYLEFPAKDLKKTKLFFETVFGWVFQDYGDDYSTFSGQGLDGGFYTSHLVMSSQKGSALVVFYSVDLAATQLKIIKAGGKIVEPVFSFPGGQRFHFTDPSNNEYAVWSDNLS